MSDNNKKGILERFLDVVERVGNKLPDPAILFFLLLIIVWVLSALLAPFNFGETDPRTGEELTVVNLLSGDQLAYFLANMTETFITFAPLGIVLLAMLGVGMAEHSGYINAALKYILGFTPKSLLTPVLILVAILSHTAVDAGYVLVIPLGGVIFYAAGRHPLAGIAAAFAGVSGGFSANFVPSGIDPLLMGFTQSAAQIMDPDVYLNPLINFFFTATSSLLIIFVGWWITDRIVEPRLSKTKVDGDEEELPKMETLNKKEIKAFWTATAVMLGGLIALFIWAAPEDSPMRSSGITPVESPGEGAIETLFVEDGDELLMGEDIAVVEILSFQRENEDFTYEVVGSDTLTAITDGIIHFEDPDLEEGMPVQAGETIAEVHGARELAAFDSPIMEAIVPLIFLIFIIPGVVYGYVAGTFNNSKDAIDSMTKAMNSMAYYIVMAFFCALFIDAFSNSNIGILIALKGAGFLESLALPGALTIIGIILLTAVVNILVGSASAKWALISPIFVPMLMGIGISPDLTQAAYRVGDSVSNIITPLLPYFPLVVVFCQRYVKGTGIGTVVSMMLPYFFIFLVLWTAYLLIYWAIGIPLGVDSSYTYP